jgi:NAD(P)-dependent dehydrogenase (short-subunit alcohol dehydrogenase family)
MGSGLAEVAARAGKTVVVRSRSQESADAMVSTLGRNLARAVERGKVRVIIPARWTVLNFIRPFGVRLDNLLLRSKSQRDLIRAYDST